MAKVDCVASADLCQKHQITAFPSIRIFIHGTDDVVDSVGRHNHLAYYGDRTTEALTLLAEQAAEAHGKKPHMHGIQNANSINQKGSGCNFSGMLLVKKVPGTLHFSARAPGHTIDYLSMNMSHHVHHLYFGNKPTKKNRMVLESKFPQYFESGWLDKMAGQAFVAENPGATYEHYLQTVLTTVEPTSSKRLKASRRLNVYVWSVRVPSVLTHSHVAHSLARLFPSGMSTRRSPMRTMRRTTPASRHVPTPPSPSLAMCLFVTLSRSRARHAPLPAGDVQNVSNPDHCIGKAQAILPLYHLGVRDRRWCVHSGRTDGFGRLQHCQGVEEEGGPWQAGIVEMR